MKSTSGGSLRLGNATIDTGAMISKVIQIRDGRKLNYKRQMDMIRNKEQDLEVTE